MGNKWGGKRKGSGRPLGSVSGNKKKEIISFRVDDDVYEQLSELGKKKGVSENIVSRDIIKSTLVKFKLAGA